MIVSVNSFSSPSIDDLQTRFLGILPWLKKCARIRFRAILCPVKRADYVAETVAICWKWFVRLAERGKDAVSFATTLASLAVQHVKAGRGLCGQERGKDVLSFTAQRRHGFKVESLPTTRRGTLEAFVGMTGGEQDLDGYEDRLRDNTQTPVPDQAAFRIDWPKYFRTLSRRDRKIAGYLSLGHSAHSAANKFGLSPGRVTQLRQQWCRDWRTLEDPDACQRGCQFKRMPVDAAAA